MDKQLYNDIKHAATITWQQGVIAKGYALPERQLDPSFLHTDRGRAALAAMQQYGINPQAPWAKPLWDLTAQYDPLPKRGPTVERHRVRPSTEARSRKSARRSAPRALQPVSSTPRRTTSQPSSRQQEAIRLSRLVQVGLRDAPDSAVTVTRLVEKHRRGRQNPSRHSLFGMPLIITTRGRTTTVAFAMEGRK